MLVELLVMVEVRGGGECGEEEKEEEEEEEEEGEEIVNTLVIKGVW